MTDHVNPPSHHQALRELLGSHALGHLDPGDAAAVSAHLEECPECRAELAEIEPLVGRLEEVDLTRFADPAPVPEPELAGRIRAAILEERRARQPAGRHLGEDRRRPRWRHVAVAAAVVLLVAGAGVVGRVTAPEPAAPPLEPVSMAATDGSDVEVDRADLVAHTWGVELRMEATGFTEGNTFRAAFRTDSGTLVPGGEFRGVGDAPMVCFLQSSVLREDVTEVVVTDERGRTVLAADL